MKLLICIGVIINCLTRAPTAFANTFGELEAFTVHGPAAAAPTVFQSFGNPQTIAGFNNNITGPSKTFVLCDVSGTCQQSPISGLGGQSISQLSQIVESSLMLAASSTSQLVVVEVDPNHGVVSRWISESMLPGVALGSLNEYYVPMPSIAQFSSEKYVTTFFGYAVAYGNGSSGFFISRVDLQLHNTTYAPISIWNQTAGPLCKTSDCQLLIGTLDSASVDSADLVCIPLISLLTSPSLQCLQHADGQVAWTFHPSDALKSHGDVEDATQSTIHYLSPIAVISPSIVALSFTTGNYTYITALNAHNGSVVWLSVPMGPGIMGAPTSMISTKPQVQWRDSPTGRDCIVVVVDSSGSIAAVGCRSGELVWLADVRATLSTGENEARLPDVTINFVKDGRNVSPSVANASMEIFMAVTVHVLPRTEPIWLFWVTIQQPFDPKGSEVITSDNPAMVLAATGLGAQIDTSAVASGVQYVGNQAQVADAVIATVSGGTGRDESFAFHVPLDRQAQPRCTMPAPSTAPQSITPQDSVSAAPTPAPNVTSCKTCVDQEGCGWCAASQSCLAGGGYGAMYPGICATASWLLTETACIPPQPPGDPHTPVLPFWAYIVMGSAAGLFFAGVLMRRACRRSDEGMITKRYFEYHDDEDLDQLGSEVAPANQARPQEDRYYDYEEMPDGPWLVGSPSQRRLPTHFEGGSARKGGKPRPQPAVDMRFATDTSLDYDRFYHHQAQYPQHDVGHNVSRDGFLERGHDSSLYSDSSDNLTTSPVPLMQSRSDGSGALSLQHAPARDVNLSFPGGHIEGRSTTH